MAAQGTHLAERAPSQAVARPAPSFHSPPSLPRDTEQGRAFFQARLSDFAKLGLAINVFIYLSSLLVLASLGVAGGFHLRTLVAEFAPVMIANVLVFGSEWLLTRRHVRQLAWLDRLDIASVFGSTVIVALTIWRVDPAERPELIAILMVTSQLAVRAAMVPSSTARSGWLSASCAVPIIATTYFFYQAHLSAGGVAGPVGRAALSTLMLLPSVVVSIYVSRIIYGLTQQVHEATQLGQYTLDEKIGEGGMGTVYKARHAMLRRPTAVKLLPSERAGEENVVRFEREVQLTSMLTHPNTVAIYDFGRTPEGVFYYAMEYLDGIDLEDLVEQDGALPASRSIHILMQVAGALEEAHGIGLIHRDVKPANIVLCERGSLSDVAKVLDFGLVKRMHSDGDEAEHSAANAVTGTPLYMSPEAILTPDRVDARSDLYALGCVGYYLLTGAPVFQARTVFEICGHHVHSAPLPPNARPGIRVPHDLEGVLMWCLEKAPDRRPRNAAALVDALAECQDAKLWQAHASRKWWSERGREIRAKLQSARASRAPSPLRPRTMNVAKRQRADWR